MTTSSGKILPWLQGIKGDSLLPLITSDAPIIRVVAGPGSGKTTGLKRRVQRLVEGEGVDPSQIYVGTFTRAISAELRNELGTAIKVSTLHALAYELLRNNPAALGGLELRFLLTHEERTMLYDISVGHIKDQNARVTTLLRQQSARDEREELPDAAFAGEVERWLRAHRGMLIGEVVHLAVQGLESEDIPRGQFEHVIVDEYQDLTAAEQQLVELIWSGKGSLVVLGDEDQSIYGFRHNHPKGLDEFSERWSDSNPETLTIPENRRCGEEIVNLGNLMMAEAGSAKPPMSSESGRSGQVSMVQWPTIEEEADGLAHYITARQEMSFLVLVPRRLVGYRLRDLIGEDARTAFHQEVLQHPLVQERFTAASVLANPSDMVAIRSWLGFRGSRAEQDPQRNNVAYRSISEFAGTGTELLRAIAEGQLTPKGEGQGNLKARAEAIVNALDGEVGEDPKERIEWLFDPALVDRINADDEQKSWIASDLMSLREAGLALAENDGISLESIVARLRYRIATRAPLVENLAQPRVRIMTLHSAKGLQGDNIVIAGVADQLVPGFAEAAQREEQRRLLYVAITRAKDSLVVSWPRNMAYDDARNNQVRIDKGTVRKSSGEVRVTLGRCSLLPHSVGGFLQGTAWLKREGVDTSD